MKMLRPLQHGENRSHERNYCLISAIKKSTDIVLDADHTQIYEMIDVTSTEYDLNVAVDSIMGIFHTITHSFISHSAVRQMVLNVLRKVEMVTLPESPPPLPNADIKEYSIQLMRLAITYKGGKESFNDEWLEENTIRILKEFFIKITKYPEHENSLQSSSTVSDKRLPKSAIDHLQEECDRNKEKIADLQNRVAGLQRLIGDK